MFLVAISPHLVVMENYLLTETLYTFFVVVAIGAGAVAVCRGHTLRGLAWATGAGGALALCSLVRPTLEHILLLLIIGTWVVPNLRTYRKSALYGMVAFVLVMAPWWVRNLEVIGRISDNSLMIHTLHHGSYPGFMYNDDPKTLGYPYRFDPHAQESEASLGAVLSNIVHKFAAEPVKYLDWYLVEKVKFFFNWDIVDGFGDIFTYPELQTPYYSNKLFLLTVSLMFGLHWFLVITGLLGSALAWTKFAELATQGWKIQAMRWLSLIILYAIGVHLIGAPFPRYSIPFRPLLYILAAFAVLVCTRWIKTHRHRLERTG